MTDLKRTGRIRHSREPERYESTTGLEYFSIVSLCCIIIMAIGCRHIAAASPDFSLKGFAACEGTAGQSLKGGTTGGAGGPVVTVSSTGEFIDNISRTGPCVILFSGTIVLPDSMYTVASHKSIIGVGSGAAINGGGGLNIGVSMDNAIIAPPAEAVHNIIIRNITFSGGKDDMINVQMYSHHIWIDHCDFSQSSDGLIDIKRGSDFCTVSWNTFHHHKKTCLLGHDDSDGAQDKGHLRVTYHHNWFNATQERHPRVRFGECHVYNNYYNDLGDYGIGIGAEAKIYSENNYFENVEDCSQFYGTGWLKDVGSYTVNIQTFVKDSSGVTWKPSDYYTYTPDSALALKTIVMQYAGVGKVDGNGAVLPPKQQFQSAASPHYTNRIDAYDLRGKRLPAAAISPCNAATAGTGAGTGLYILKYAHGARKQAISIR